MDDITRIKGHNKGLHNTLNMRAHKPDLLFGIFALGWLLKVNDDKT